MRKPNNPPRPASAGLDAVSSFNIWWSGRRARQLYDALTALHDRQEKAGAPDPHPAPSRALAANPYRRQPDAKLWADGWNGVDLDRRSPIVRMKAEELWRSEWAS